MTLYEKKLPSMEHPITVQMILITAQETVPLIEFLKNKILTECFEI